MTYTVKVEVSGLPRSGKTVIGTIIKDALTKAGIHVELDQGLPPVDLVKFNPQLVDVLMTEKDTQ